MDMFCVSIRESCSLNSIIEPKVLYFRDNLVYIPEIDARRICIQGPPRFLGLGLGVSKMLSTIASRGPEAAVRQVVSLSLASYLIGYTY